MIKLDWDNITFPEAKRRIDYIFKNQLVKSIDLRYSSFSGYHVYIETHYPINPVFIYRLRRAWKDDGRRLVVDILFRDDQTPKDILFVSKRDKGGLEWKEIPIMILNKESV